MSMLHTQAAETRPGRRRCVALIAHDGKKPALREFAREHIDALRHFDLVATATSGRIVRDETGLEVRTVESSPLGGDVQIAAKIVEGDVIAVIFLVDPLNAHPHDPDIQAVLRICNVHNVAVATNVTTAKLLLAGLTE